ncbi:hypothetical protein RT99_02730 [Flavobacterium sp. MEB061]|uniref:hypothetical protein n=1 Tax=Flavobacterium sp. MEB061 TaxID=1587524 RepID=UPI0005ACC75F|nr:hypothetical protein [Flavobacterium sp. MEB061]KIQ24301.1 hypothetical protein RT99_02730 [Flavobacterium sp. MEB061]
MRKLSFQKPIWNVVLLVTMSLLFINCSSSHYDEVIPSNNAAFNVADFSLNITRKQLYGDYLAIDFDVKNISKTSYSVYEQGTFSVKFTAKSTDGEVFQRTTYVDYLETGVTYSDYVHLAFSANKTLDVSTLTAVIVKD